MLKEWTELCFLLNTEIKEGTHPLAELRLSIMTSLSTEYCYFQLIELTAIQLLF